MKLIKIYVDEAWRWPLAWPVTVWAVIPWKRFITKDFSDSKWLSETKRNLSYEKALMLQEKGKVFFWTWWSSNKYIDKYWIMNSLQKACCDSIFKAIKNLYASLWIEARDKELFRKRTISPKKLKELLIEKNNIFEIVQIVIDWNHDFWLWNYLSVPIKTIIKWDSKVSYIWFASIIAKVERDNYMSSLWKKYKQYWFSQHKWYGTLAHRKAIKKHWCSDLHRKTFCKNII